MMTAEPCGEWRASACSCAPSTGALPPAHACPSHQEQCDFWLQAVACIGLIIAGGRTLLRPIYRRMADMGNTDVFAATTLLVVLGTSVLTQIAGLSLALGAFLVSSVQISVLIPVVRSLSEIHL